MMTAVLVLSLGMGLPAAASQIDFDSLAGAADYSPIPATFGSTAQVNVAYQTDSSPGVLAQSNIEFWNSGGYGDLPYAAFSAFNGDYAEITLTPTAGYTVTLQNFELAGWPSADTPNETVRIRSGVGGSVLADYSPITIKGTGTPAHTLFSANLTSSGPLTIEWGPDWDAGINYINFTSAPTGVVPEPSSFLLLGAGFAGIAGYIRRRRVV
jgi:hypothetical protein